MSERIVTENTSASRYEIHVDGELAGHAEYRRRGGNIALTHTVVDDKYEGQGVGSALAKGALDNAMAEGLGVLPFCPFIRSWIERHPTYLALVPADRQAEFGLAVSR